MGVLGQLIKKRKCFENFKELVNEFDDMKAKSMINKMYQQAKVLLNIKDEFLPVKDLK